MVCAHISKRLICLLCDVQTAKLQSLVRVVPCMLHVDIHTLAVSDVSRNIKK